MTAISSCKRLSQITNKYTYKNKKGEDKQMDVYAIPNNMEKYMTFMLVKHVVSLTVSNSWAQVLTDWQQPSGIFI